MIMDDNTFNNCKDSIDYLEENVKNYYFRKRYQRYNPSPEALDAFRKIDDRINVVVLASRTCPICIATVPMLIRLQLDVENPNVYIRVAEDDSISLPPSLSDKKSPFVIFYDNNFNELFRLEQKDIETNFEYLLTEELGKVSNGSRRTNI